MKRGVFSPKLTPQQRLEHATRGLNCHFMELSEMIIQEKSHDAASALIDHALKMCDALKTLSTDPLLAHGIVARAQTRSLTWPTVHCAISATLPDDEKEVQAAYLARTGTALGIKTKWKTKPVKLSSPSAWVAFRLWQTLNMLPDEPGAFAEIFHEWTHFYPCSKDQSAPQALVARAKALPKLSRSESVIDKWVEASDALLRCYLGRDWPALLMRVKDQPRDPWHLFDQDRLPKDTLAERRNEAKGIFTKAFERLSR